MNGLNPDLQNTALVSCDFLIEFCEPYFTKISTIFMILQQQKTQIVVVGWVVMFIFPFFEISS